MIADAALPLQKAIISALKNDSAVNALVAGRIFDSVSAGAVMPYLSVGPIDAVTEVAEEYEGSDTSIQLDGWSQARGSVEIKHLGRAVRSALHYQDLVLDESQRLVLLAVEQVRYLVDPDGLTQHAVITLRARTEPS